VPDVPGAIKIFFVAVIGIGDDAGALVRRDATPSATFGVLLTTAFFLPGHTTIVTYSPAATAGLRNVKQPIDYVAVMRLVIAECSVTYAGRLNAYLPPAKRLIMFKADGAVLVHSDGGSYKPLNWMTPPAKVMESEPTETQAAEGITAVWTVQSQKSDDHLIISVYSIEHESCHELGVDPGLVKDGVEADLQRLLAEQMYRLGSGYKLIRREYMTAIGPVDILAKNGDGETVAVELKRRGDIDGVEQLSRYVELLNRDPLLAPVHGVFAAQQIKPQARVLAEDRGFTTVTLDYDAMRGVDDAESRLF